MKEFEFECNKGHTYLIESEKEYKQWDKIFDKDYGKNLVANGVFL